MPYTTSKAHNRTSKLRTRTHREVAAPPSFFECGERFGTFEAPNDTTAALRQRSCLDRRNCLTHDVPGFWGPNIGIRKKNRTGGGGLAASMAAAAPVESSMKELMTRGASASIAPLPKGLQDVKDESKLRTESL